MSTLLESPIACSTAEPEAQSRSSTSSGCLRMLVVTDTDLTLRGGSERFLAYLLEGLDPNRFSIDVIQLDQAEPGTARQPTPIAGRNLKLEYRPVGAIYGIAAFRVWRELRARVKQGHYDLIQSQHEKSDLLCALLPAGSRTPMRISNRRDTGFQKGLIVRLLFRLINHRFDRFIAPAQAILEQLARREGVDPNKTHCLPNGVDCERFIPRSRQERLAQRHWHSLPPNQYLFGCAARMVPVKRHRDLIDGFVRVAEAHPQAGLILIGRGPLEHRLRDQVAQLGLVDRVIFHGEERDMPGLLPLLDAFLLASSTEGMSNAILEAMACGLPTIATDVGGNSELVEAGLTGFLVPPRSPDQIALAMGELLARPELGPFMGRHARDRAVSHFSLPGMLSAFTSYYRTCQPVLSR